eukprot:GILK01009669.1.p1 GENE.GILK01009669.1~~GILK01009669.1.p1  ORF type:complete len:854 (-),score=107.20 GILK01009669.1:121-2682(-)
MGTIDGDILLPSETQYGSERARQLLGGEREGHEAALQEHEPIMRRKSSAKWETRSASFESLTFDDVDERDKDTPDNWIKRSPQLVRLTGNHPLNAEPPLSCQLQYEFKMPSALHYVRNHGAVPKLDWDTHTVEVKGLVSKPTTFSMADLSSMSFITRLVTMACDGNRRKELNMIKHSRGFNWGPGAVSTAEWTGVPLCALLEACGVERGPNRYVCFEGSDQLPNGFYGTSIRLGVAMDPTNDIIIAYKMNGHHLTPDHGFPIRVVIPGYVGGRNVKWLRRITVSDKESTSWYHYHDNRVFPPGIDYTNVDSGDWWHRPETLLNQLNVNSVICSPEHDEWLTVDEATTTKHYIRGYAYSGGGRRINRVEVSLDRGITWVSCEIQYPSAEPIAEEGLNHYGKVWTMCLWKLELHPWKLLRSDEVVVRAWDESFNTQPAEPTWNLMGMMNNSWYRIKIELDQDAAGPPSMSFKHPVVVGGSEGWKTQQRELQYQSLMPRVPPVTPLPKHKQFTMDEVAKHNKPDDCWIVVDDAVLDITNYLSDHPGGMIPAVLFGGKDASTVFREIHGQDAWDITHHFQIGQVVASDNNQESGRLDPRQWAQAVLVRKTQITSDVVRLLFKFPHCSKVGLPQGQHVLLGAHISDQFVVRPYTPVSPTNSEEDEGLFECVVRVYRPSDRFPRGGLLSCFLGDLKVGESVQVKGPAGPILYEGNGVFVVGGRTLQARHVSMIAGGTGITPMFQLIKAITRNPNDKTEVRLIFANRTVEDILLRKELDEINEQFGDRVKIWYTVSVAPHAEQEWKYDVGFVCEQMGHRHLFPPSRDTIALLCGPPVMLEHACYPLLNGLGYRSNAIFEF